MTDNVKEKLLAAINDVAFDDLSAARLVDVLTDKVKDLQKDIERLKGSNARREIELDRLIKSADEEYQRLRTSPQRAWQQTEPFYFLDDKGDLIEVLVSYGDVKVMKKTKKSRLALERICWAEAEAKL